MKRAAVGFWAVLSLFACHGARLGTTEELDGHPSLSVMPPQGTSCTAADRTASHAEWATLRTTFPYHLQTVAVSPAFPSGCRALVIAEPPPGTTLSTVQAVSSRVLDSGTAERHTIGYDGWTEDLVFTLPALPEQTIAELVAELNSSLYSTTYGSHVVNTRAAKPAFDPKATPLDVAVGPGDLRRWLLAGRSSELEPLYGGKRAPFRQLLEAGEGGVYIDIENALVTWIIPRSADIAKLAGTVRQFAVASDLIIGAVASKNAVAVIARQRVVDDLVLPPLRFETVLLLAAVGDQQLGQSFERNGFLSGRADKRNDWAPIYLSPALVDSEYGSILNIADQELKSWSNIGTTQYVNFNYPKPARWPFAVPIWKLAGHDSLRYNWNTENASAAIEVDDVDVLWLRRTGALNVSYFADEDTDDADANRSVTDGLEGTAYKFFTSTQDPTLVRVVQYNALYQIFSRYGLRSSLAVSQKPVTDPALALHHAVKAALVSVRDAYPAAIERRMAAGQNAAAGQDTSARDSVVEFVTGLSGALKTLDDNQLNVLAAALTEPELLSATGENSKSVFAVIALSRGVLPLFLGKSVYEAYSRASVPTPGTRIHTPSVVVSWNDDTAVGGHDLMPRVAQAKVVPSRRAPPALDRVTGKVVVGPADIDRLTLDRQGLSFDTAVARRAPREALGIGRRRMPSEWQPVKPSEPDVLDADMHVSRGENGFGFKVVREGREHHAATTPEVVELLSRPLSGKTDQAEVMFKGFTADEVRGITRSAETKYHAELIGLSEGSPRMSKAQLDFTTAKIVDSEARMSGGRGLIRVTLNVTTEQRVPLSMKLGVLVRDVTPPRLKQHLHRVRFRISQLIRRKPGTLSSPKVTGIMLRDELKNLIPDADQVEVRLRMQTEATDFTIVEIDSPEMSHGTSGRPS